MRRHRLRNGTLAALTAALLGLTVAVLGGFCLVSAEAQPTTVSAIVGSTPTGPPLPKGYLGLSLEYTALQAYAGRDPRAVNPLLIQLVRALAPEQTPVLRIGGDSADATWWPQRGLPAPVGAKYTLTTGWLKSARALADALGAKLILGVNLAGNRPSVAAAEARALLRGIGRGHVQALEIGNEPDTYGQFPWYLDRRGKVVYARARNYSLTDYIGQFSRWRSALGRSTPVTGPSFAELSWLGGLGAFIASEPGLRMVTIHRYPLHGCLNDPSTPGYPSVANLLDDQASSGLARAVAPYVSTAHAAGAALRLDEMNSAAVAACIGRRGVSGQFASALWVLDTLFNLASVGVDGVNIHSLPRAAYELFTFKRTVRLVADHTGRLAAGRAGGRAAAGHTGRLAASNTGGLAAKRAGGRAAADHTGRPAAKRTSRPAASKHTTSPHASWQAFVHPEYYGMLLFTQAFPPGAQLLPVNVNPTGPLKVWATRAPDGTTRVVVINKDPGNDYQVQLRVPQFAGPAQLERLQASAGATATGGVTLGGRTFGDSTSTGVLGPPQTEAVAPVLGTYTFTVPAASAAMLSPATESGGAGVPGAS